LAGHARHHDPLPEEHRPPRGRAARRRPGPRRRRRHASPQRADADPRVPAGQGAPIHARAPARPRRGPRRGCRAARGALVSHRPGRAVGAVRDRPPHDRGHLRGGGAAVQVHRHCPRSSGGQAGRLPGLPVRARDRRRGRFEGGPRRGRASRPAGHARAGGGARREGRRLGRDRLRRDTRRRAVRGRHGGADAHRHRPGAPDPGLRGAPRRPACRRLHRVRHHVPAGLPGGPPPGRDRPLHGDRSRAPGEGPADRGRRVCGLARRVRGPCRPAIRHPVATRPKRAGQGTPRLRRPDHRLRGEERHHRDPGPPRRRGGRGDARRAPRCAGAPGDHRGGLPQGRGQDPGAAPRGLPPGRRRAREDAPRARPDRRVRGYGGHRRRRRSRGVARQAALRQRPEARRLLRHGACPGCDPQLAAPLAGGREADRRVAGGTPRTPGDPAHRGR